MNSLGLDWRGCVCVCVCVDAGGGQWVREGVASLEMVNRIIKRAPVLPRRQKWLMISLIFVAQSNTGWTLWTFIASARNFQQAFHHTQLWPCEIPCNFANSQCVGEAAGGENKIESEREREREKTCYRRLPDVPSIPWGTALEKFSVNFRHLNAKMRLIWDDNRHPNRSWSFCNGSQSYSTQL